MLKESFSRITHGKETGRPEMSEMDESIEIGDYTLSRTNGRFWITHKSGEGMEVADELIAKFVDQFYKEHF